VNKLYSQIKGSYDTIDTHVSIDNSRRRMAEVDILAKKGDIIDIYEVKCSYKIIKAKKQLKRIKRILNAQNINLFFFCGESSRLEEVLV
jgi:Holliday junction resolvase-like predicted endonuclease